MATRKVSKGKSSHYKNAIGGRKRTARRHRTATAGKILPPLDVRSDKHLGDFKKRLMKGPLTIVLVYADWCGHCHTMMPHFDAAAKSANRSIQAVKVNEQMLPAVNSYVNKNINKSAKPLNVEGYPSIILVNKNGEKVTDIEPVRDTKTMTEVMNQTGNLAKEASLNMVENGINNSVNNSIKLNNKKNNSMKLNNNNVNDALLKNIGVEEKGLVTPTNSDMGEEELKGSISSVVNNSKNNKKNNSINLASKNMEKNVEDMDSLTAPVEPPSMSSDVESTSISNSLTPAQKIGGGSRGGSLLNAMTRTTYSIAAPAALLATAAMVLKGKSSRKMTRKNKRKALRRKQTKRYQRR